MNRKAKYALYLAGSLLLLWLTGHSLLTSAPVRAFLGTDGTLRACVDDSSGALIVAAPAAPCAPNWSAHQLSTRASGDLAAIIARSQPGSRVDLACGVYPISAAVQLDKPLHLAGAARDCVVLQATASNINLLRVTSDGVVLENLTLIGNGSTSGVATGNLILVEDAGDLTVRHNRLQNWGQDALRSVSGTNPMTHIRIESNLFLDGWDNPGYQHDVALIGAHRNVIISGNSMVAQATNGVEYAIFVANLGSNVYQDIAVTNNHIAGHYGRACIAMTDETPDGTLRVQGVSVADNIISDCRAQAIHLKNVPRFSISGNVISGVNSAGIGGGIDGDITAAGTGGVITGNTITGGRVGIQVNRMANAAGTALDDGYTISGNQITDAGSDGIRLSTGTRSAAVSGNTIRGCAEAGVAIRSAELVAHVSINGNVIRGCNVGIATIGTGGVRKEKLLIAANVIADSRGNGLQLRESNQVTIVNNIIVNSGASGGPQAGILVTAVDGLLISGNVINDQFLGVSLRLDLLNVHIINNDLRNNAGGPIDNPQLAALVWDNLSGP